MLIERGATAIYKRDVDAIPHLRTGDVVIAEKADTPLLKRLTEEADIRVLTAEYLDAGLTPEQTYAAQRLESQGQSIHEIAKSLKTTEERVIFSKALHKVLSA